MSDKAELKFVEETLATVTKEVKKPELIDRVVAVSGMKKKDVKPVVEAMLTVLGQSLSEEEQLNLQPFGRVRVIKKKDMAGGQALTLKLRRSSAAQDESSEAGASEGLAEADAAS